MHDYAIAAGKRRQTVQSIVCIYMLLIFVSPMVEDKIICILENCFGLQLPTTAPSWFFVKNVIAVLGSGIGIGIIYSIFNKWAWKWFYRFHHIPDLNGEWQGTIKAGLKGYEPTIDFTIKQTWNKIQVYGMSKNETITVSETASILEQHGQIWFGYSYWIMNKEGQCYPGYNSLCYKRGKLCGTYCSGKNISNDVNRFIDEKIKLKRQNSSPLSEEREAEMKKEEEMVRAFAHALAPGCGSKGEIQLERK